MRSYSKLVGIVFSPSEHLCLWCEARVGSLHSKWRSALAAAPLKVALRCIVAFVALCACMPAWAHIGPPYPIMQNRKVGRFNVEVWSNPDVGTGSFYVIVDPPKGSGLTVPADLKVQVAVQPASKRLPVAVYNAWRDKLLDHVEFKAVVPFDKEETWHVHITFSSSTTNGAADTDVAVTPTLLGRWDLLIFLLPFAGIGILWFKAASVKRNRGRRRRTPQKATTQSVQVSRGMHE